MFFRPAAKAAHDDILTGTCDSFCCVESPIDKTLSGRANVLMVARDRCCQRRHPVWKYVFLFFFSFFLLLFFFLGPSFFFEERRKKGQKGGGRGKEVGREWGSAGSEASGVNRAEFRRIDEKH